VQTGEPVEHTTVAVTAQALADAQSAPAVQAAQVPELQTWFGPHAAPFGSGSPSTQTGVPELQVTAPVMQGLAGVQATPFVQATHCPVLLQTRSSPQEVPGAARLVSAQTGLPEAQEMAAPVAQGLDDVQAVPAGQVSQTPSAEQTSPPPQGVPAGKLNRAVHTARPLEHS
jgi:hypothetical protein